jgi:hypothetical protein
VLCKRVISGWIFDFSVVYLWCLFCTTMAALDSAVGDFFCYYWETVAMFQPVAYHDSIVRTIENLVSSLVLVV